MSAESVLSSIVEVAIGIAGFAGIIAAVRQGRITRWSPEPRLLLEMLLTASALAIVFALLPGIVMEAGFSRDATWRTGSSLILVSQLGLGVFRTRQFRLAGFDARPPIHMMVWYTPIVLLQAANVALGTSWLYLLGVIGVVGNGFFFFLRLLFSDWDEPDADA